MSIQMWAQHCVEHGSSITTEKWVKLESRNRNPRFQFCWLSASYCLGPMLCVYCILLQPLSYFTQLIDLLGEYKTAWAAAAVVAAKWKQLFQIFPKAWRSPSLILLSLLLQHVDFHLWRVKKPRVKSAAKKVSEFINFSQSWVKDRS